MTAIAITRGGWGSVWRFTDKESADLHPLVQYGDAIIGDAAEIAHLYNRLELPVLLSRMGLSALSLEIRNAAGENPTTARWLYSVEQRVDPIWEKLLQLAQDPPKDPKTVFEKIREDRIAMLTQETPTMAKKDKAAAAGGDKTKTEKKARQPRASSKYNDGDVIRMGKDKNDKPYHGVDNNPKRGKAAERFAHLRDGMTAGQFAEKVGNKNAAYADLAWGELKGQLTIEKAAGAEGGTDQADAA